MSYNSENGIISAPVSIYDVKRALGESSNDLATLCKSENINIWSKYKPISCKGEFKEYPIREDSEEIVTSSYNKYTCVVRCGGDEFVIVYKGNDVEDLCQRIHDSIQKLSFPFELVLMFKIS